MTPFLQRVVHEIRNPRLPALIGFALAVMIAAALLSAGRDGEEATPGEAPSDPPAGDPAVSPASP